MILFLATAMAQGGSCDTVYSNSSFETAVNEVDRLMEKADIDRSINVLRKTQNLLPCMEELVNRSVLARFSRHYALISFLQQDAEQAVRWGYTFEATDPNKDWGDTPADHPLFNMMKGDAPAESEAPAADAGWAHEKKGAVFMNGSFAPQPAAQEGHNYLVQVFQGRGYLSRAYWQDGTVFANDLVDASGPTQVPKFLDLETHIITPKGKPPPVAGTKAPKKAPIVPLAAGAGLLVVGGVLYALAGAAEGKLKCDPSDGDEGCPQTSEELTALRSRANLMVMGAGIAGIAGLGVGVSGIFIADQTPTLAITGRF